MVGIQQGTATWESSQTHQSTPWIIHLDETEGTFLSLNGEGKVGQWWSRPWAEGHKGSQMKDTLHKLTADHRNT